MLDKDFLEEENNEKRQDIILGEEQSQSNFDETDKRVDATSDMTANANPDEIAGVRHSTDAEQTDGIGSTREEHMDAITDIEEEHMGGITDFNEEHTDVPQEEVFVQYGEDMRAVHTKEDDDVLQKKALQEEVFHASSSAHMQDEPSSNYSANADAMKRRFAKVKPRKKKSALGRAVALVASAAAFGLIAGTTMVGVQKYARVSGFLPKSTTTVIGRSVESTTSGETLASNLVNTQNTDGVALNFSEIVDKAMPSVVAINGKAQTTYESWFGTSQTYTIPTSGSGIIIGENDEELLIVTNNHVVDETSELSVVFIDDTQVKATVKGGDSDSDLAVIAVKFADISDETKDKITIASIGNSDNIKVGEGVVAIGNALGYGQSVTQGIISAKDRVVETKNGKTEGLIQTDAAINPGNSGGALLNLRGEVIGINSIKYSSTEVEGMGYAIPITAVEDIIQELSTKVSRTAVDEAKQGTLGIRGQDIDKTMSETYDIPQGVYVYRILENGAAANSDLQEKDIITKLEGEKVRSMEDLKENLSYFSAGEKVSLTIQRQEGSEYVEKTIEITLGKRSDLNR